MRLTTTLMARARVTGHGYICTSDGELLCVHKQWRAALLAGIFCTGEQWGVAGRSVCSQRVKEERHRACSLSKVHSSK